MKADEESRSKEADGKRLLPLDTNRNWGWQIVNYEHYRAIQDEEARRQYFRNAKRKQRGTKIPSKTHKPKPNGIFESPETEGEKRDKELRLGLAPGQLSKDEDFPF